MRTLIKKRSFLFCPVAIMVVFTTGCSNSICDELVLEVELLEKKAKENYDFAMKNQTTITKGSSYSIEYTRSEETIKEEFHREMRIPARIISNNQKCFDAKRVAEAQELIAKE